MKNFYMRQKFFSIGDKYNIYDNKNNLVYTARSKIFTLSACIYLLRDSKEIYTIQKKLLSFLPKYQLLHDGQIIAQVNKRLTLFKHSLHIESKFGELNINGDVFAHDFEITNNNNLVCSFHKAWLTFSDSYEIKVYDDINCDFYVALIILIDNCIHNENSNNNINN